LSILEFPSQLSSLFHLMLAVFSPPQRKQRYICLISAAFVAQWLCTTHFHVIWWWSQTYISEHSFTKIPNGFVGSLCLVCLPCYLVSLPLLVLKYVESVETSQKHRFQNAKSSVWLNGINHPICVGAATLVHNCLLMVACQWQ